MAGSWCYPTGTLSSDYPGMVDGISKDTATMAGSSLGVALYMLRHNLKLPTFTVRQLVAAILLGFKDRYATRRQIVETMAKLPAVSLLLTVVDGVEQLEAVQSVLAFLDDDKEKYHSDFPLKEASPPTDPDELAQWHADMCRDVTEQEQDPAGVKPYNYDYSQDDWLEEF
jgi:hypothetical protein